MAMVSNEDILFLQQPGDWSQALYEGLEQQTVHHGNSLSLKRSPVEMESMQELIPFAREMLSQKPGRGLLRVYLLGSVFAVLGTIIGLVEAVCSPLSSGRPTDADVVLMLALEERRNVKLEARPRCNVWSQEEEEEEEEELTHKNGAVTRGLTLSKTHGLSHRSTATRLHAS